MQVISDLHIHSKYARAVSQNMVVPEIANWASKKGIDLVATGDWTHPLWSRELQANLEEVVPGLYGLKKRVLPLGSPAAIPPGNNTGAPSTGLPASRHPLIEDKLCLFLLSTEVSCIYSQGGKGRRIHILIFAPSFEVAEKINREFARRGANLLSDGRPIMGLSSKDVAELVLSLDPTCLLIPAHAWTPWFSLYGSKSGFDSIEECFGEFSKYIYAIETGLSSDPAMNWRIPELENRNIVSFSDAHSPSKLGREATVFQIQKSKIKNQNDKLKFKISYKDIADAIKGNQDGNWEIGYTIEFYPEEGKYHYTGHRNCNVRQSPQETEKRGTTCHVCGKPLTVGVMHRVEELADRKMENGKWKLETDANGVRWINHPDGGRPKYIMMVPLIEILSEVLSSGTSSKKVVSEYEKLTNTLGPEFKILLQIKPEEIEKLSGPKVCEAILRVRSGQVSIDPGYDGVFGKVKIWPFDSAQGKKPGGKENAIPTNQLDLF